MADRITVSSKEEADQLVNDGYAIISIQYFVTGDQPSYTLEKGTDRSKMLGSE